MKKIFLIIWGDAKFYNTLIFLSQKLSKTKYKIYLIPRNFNQKKNIFKNVYFGKNIKIINYPNFSIKDFNKLEYIIFYLNCIINFLKIKPDTVIFFNNKSLYISAILKFFKRGSRFIYHNFDFDRINKKKNWREKLLIYLEFLCSNYCNYLIFPSKKRFRLFKKISKIKENKFYSLMNCFPDKYVPGKSIKFRSFLKKNNLLNKQIVCHMGTIGPNHHLIEIIKSFKFLNNKIVLVIAGVSVENYSDKIRNLINKLKLNKKIFIFENISNNHWFEIIKNSKVGLCFYNNVNISHKYMAGTSTKFNNYLFLNIPMLVNDNKDFLNFKKKYDVFNTANPNLPRDIASGIKKLIRNKKRYNIVKKNMRIAYKSYLNFEHQFNKSYGRFL